MPPSGPSATAADRARRPEGGPARGGCERWPRLAAVGSGVVVGSLAVSCKCQQTANDTTYPPPAPSAARATALPFSHDASLSTNRAIRAARRPRRRGHRRCPHARHLLVRAAPPAQRTPRPERRAAVLGCLACAAGPVRPARPHRSVPQRPALAPGCGARSLPQHREPRAAQARGPAPHLPQRLCGPALARQSAAHLRPDGAGLQRPPSAKERPARRGGRRGQRLVGRGQAAARAAAATTGGRLGAAGTRRPARRVKPKGCRTRAALRERRRSRAPRRAARATRSDPREGRRAASPDPAGSATPSGLRPGRRGSRGRSTRPTPRRRGAT